LKRRLFFQNLIKSVIGIAILEKTIVTERFWVKTNLSSFKFIGSPDKAKFLIYDIQSESAKHMKTYLKNIDRSLFKQVRAEFEKSGKFVSVNTIQVSESHIITQIEFDSSSAMRDFQMLSNLGSHSARSRREKLGIKMDVTFSFEPSPLFPTQV
jgi:hypothetical protein